MYQSVGTQLLPYIAESLSSPLFQHVIRGTAVEQGAEYGHRLRSDGVQGDETEDLYLLLRTVLVSWAEE